MTYGTDNGLTWSAWVPLIPQRSNNANGDFVRYADGTLICTSPDLSAAKTNTADGSLFCSANVVWTYPSAFLAGTVPKLSGCQTRDADAQARPISTTVTAGTLRLRSTITKAAAITFRAPAIERWF